MKTDYRYGWVPDLPDHRDLVRETAPEDLSNLPAKVDLRDSPNMPPVYNQLQIGSCTANGIAAALEFALRSEKLTDFMPSRLFIYYNERAMEGTVGSDSGAQIRDGVKSVATQGVCPEDEWPYDGDPANSDGSWPAGQRAGQKPISACYAAASGAEAVQYERVPQDVAHIKATLAAGVPVIFGFSVYDSFESHEVAETGQVPMPAPGEAQLGGHCVLAVGYDDATKRFKVRNSWGTGWGKAGYCTMPYAYLGDSRLASDMWTIKKVN